MEQDFQLVLGIRTHLKFWRWRRRVVIDPDGDDLSLSSDANLLDYWNLWQAWAADFLGKNPGWTVSGVGEKPEWE